MLEGGNMDLEFQRPHKCFIYISESAYCYWSLDSLYVCQRSLAGGFVYKAEAMYCFCRGSSVSFISSSMAQDTNILMQLYTIQAL